MLSQARRVAPRSLETIMFHSALPQSWFIAEQTLRMRKLNRRALDTCYK